MSRPVQIVNIN